MIVEGRDQNRPFSDLAAGSQKIIQGQNLLDADSVLLQFVREHVVVGLNHCLLFFVQEAVRLVQVQEQHQIRSGRGVAGHLVVDKDRFEPVFTDMAEEDVVGEGIAMNDDVAVPEMRVGGPR